MVIKSSFIWEGQTIKVEYTDVDDFSSLNIELCKQVYAMAFVDDTIIIVKDSKTGRWGLIGGGHEKGETIEETLRRELKEEANMEVISWAPIGYQKVISEDGSYNYQLRCCCLVKPFGAFIEDPDGDVTEIKFIKPLDYKQYFDWEEIGERIINRGIELHKKLKAN